MVSKGYSLLEREELATRTKALTEEEKKFIIAYFPTQILLNEIERRTDSAVEKFRQLFEILDNCKEEMSLVEMQDTLLRCKEALKMERHIEVNAPTTHVPKGTN